MNVFHVFSLYHTFQVYSAQLRTHSAGLTAAYYTAYLGISEIQYFVQQLVNQDKVVLDVLLGDFSEVVPHDLDDLVEELEDEGGVDVLLGNGRNPNVDALHVKEARTRDVGHWGPNLLARVNDVHAKG